MSADPRLQRLLGGQELAAVRQRLRRRFEQAEPDTSLESIILDKLDPDAHRALCQLSGRPSRSSRSMTLNVADLDIRLRAAGLADSLRDALELLEGPIVPRARLRMERETQWRAVADASGPMLRAWLASSPVALGLLKRLSRDLEHGTDLLVAVDAVLARLPATGMPRSRLAAETLGDAHALDTGKQVATLVLAAWRYWERRAGDGPLLETDPLLSDEPPVTTKEAAAERVREVWARAGVSVSEMARPALFLNLPIPAGSRHAWILGEPDYLSLRQLLRQPPSWSVAGRRIYVCENPDIVAIAADRLGAGCAPLVCTEGMPAAAQRILLDQLATAGAQLCYHGDYDWPGIGIGNFVMRTWRAFPWRFSAFEYRAAIGQAPSRPRDLGATRVEALWDAELAAAMDEYGLVLAEEAVAEHLLDDLHHDPSR